MKKGVYFLLTSLVMISCTEALDEHYQSNGSVLDQSLYQMVCDDPLLSDFREVLDSVKLFSNFKMTDISYGSFLDGDQFFTLYAPVNGSFNKDSLLLLCQTAYGDSLVEQQFVKNHLARFRHSVSSATNESVLMYNGKQFQAVAGEIGGSSVDAQKRNLVARNGIMNYLEDEIVYRFNIYEGIIFLPEFLHVGNFFKKYQQLEFDEDNSLAAGIVNGVTIYVDSVFKRKNILLNKFQDISCEDSVLWMVLPDAAAWNGIYDSAFSYFNYAYINKADSLQYYWTNYSLIQDMVFNPHQQRSMQDSLMSTTYRNRNYPYHVYFNPFAADGIVGSAYDSVTCSNGLIYRLKEWPYDFEKIFYKPIKVEGEAVNRIIDCKLGTYNVNRENADSISGNAYLDLIPSNSSSKVNITYSIPNTLSGSYDINVVLLPKSVYDPNKSDRHKPFLFTAELTYYDEQGEQQSYAFDNYNSSLSGYVNDPFVVDTVMLGTFSFPVCQYDQETISVTLKLSSSASNKQTVNYTREAYIDCIYLKPHHD